MMENTFTYTARNAERPEQAVTFTLFDHRLTVDMGAPTEQISRMIGRAPEQRVEEGAQPEGGRRMRPTSLLKPMAVSMVEKGTHPFHISDVSAKAKGGGLRVTTWVRAGGLRVAPVMFSWNRVDNPEGAKTFVKELERRQETAERPGRFLGPMDYWVSWLLGVPLVLTALLVPGVAMLRRRGQRMEGEMEWQGYTERARRAREEGCV